LYPPSDFQVDKLIFEIHYSQANSERIVVTKMKIRNCLKFENMPKIKKFTPALKGDFLIFRAPFRVWGIPKNQNE
jgi:hypothetical protein